MKLRSLSLNSGSITVILLLLLFAGPVYSQKNKTDRKTVKESVSKEKKFSIDYLSDTAIIRKYGLISDAIWRYAELGMQEFKSSALLAETIEKEGFTVERGVAGIPTCFVATWGSGHPVIGILGEYDALPGLSQKAITPLMDPVVEGAPGHGCGHNMMGTAGIAAAIAVKRTMEANHLKGTIKFFGSPAEEVVISRPYMVREGVFNDVDAVIDNHASGEMSTGYGVNGNAIMSVIFSFKGKTAHAAGTPWLGRSALDGVELMNVATNYLREHLFYTQRMHYVVTEGGDAPNIVPDHASVWYYIRNTDDRLEEMYGRVLDCAKGAAIASGTKLDTVTFITAVHQRHSNKGLAEVIQKNMELIGMPAWTSEENDFAKALQHEIGVKETGYSTTVKPINKPPETEVGGSSSDVGEVTMVVPTATLNFPGGVPGEIGHHWSTTTSGYGSAAWKGLNTGARVMAATAIDLIMKADVLANIKKEFTEYTAGHPYKSFLPQGAKPPLTMNKEVMDKYRELLDKASK